MGCAGVAPGGGFPLESGVENDSGFRQVARALGRTPNHAGERRVSRATAVADAPIWGVRSLWMEIAGRDGLAVAHRRTGAWLGCGSVRGEREAPD